MRPQSIAEVARRAGSIEFELADFLHAFTARRDYAMLEEEPPLLEVAVDNAYLAATAAYLSQQIGHTPPAWVNGPQRVLKEPWFASNSPHLRAVLLVESPAAFRARNLFVSANALSVA
ncbi:MAG: hypothetical protein FJW38_07145 [Acidobacteria bacterium]|nr:hypothetical protein [Acidobacteriota bacterium]